MEKILQVGVITTTHGVHGQVKVYPTTDDPKRFEKLKEVILNDGHKQQVLEIESVKYFKDLVILKFKDLDNVDDVEKFRKSTLWVTRENAVPLGEDENYVADLIGMKVISDQGEDLGTLTDIMETGANDVYVVQKKGSPELLIPAIKACILETDIIENRMLVHLLPGLRDL